MTTPAHIDRLILGLAIVVHINFSLGTALIEKDDIDWVDRTERRDLSVFQLGGRYLYRSVILHSLEDLRLRFNWQLDLPPLGFRPALTS